MNHKLWSEVAYSRARLLEQVSLGDDGAFKLLYKGTRPFVFYVIQLIEPNHAKIEEIVQETFIKVWLSAGDYDPKSGSPTTWIATIARNTTYDSLRRDKTRPRLVFSDDLDAYQIPEVRTSDQVDIEKLYLKLKLMPKKQQQSLILCYFHDFTHMEIAAHLDLPLGTVKAWIKRSLVKLQKGLS